MRSYVGPVRSADLDDPIDGVLDFGTVTLTNGRTGQPPERWPAAATFYPLPTTRPVREVIGRASAEGLPAALDPDGTGGRRVALDPPPSR